MNLGLSLSLSATRRARPFSPAVLFAASESGVWLDPSDPATVFSDTAGTTQAGVGDPVADRKDKSGNNGSIPQATTANRPTYVEVEGKGALLYNGINQVLLHDLNGATSGLRVIGTPWGHQIDNGVPLSAARTPMLVESQFIARQGAVSPATVDQLSKLMNGDRQYFAAQTNSATLVNLLMQMDNAETPEVRCIGYNGVETTVTLGGGSDSSADLETAGLTAPFTVLFPIVDDPTSLVWFYCYDNQLTGSIPSLASNTSLVRFYCYNNQLTGSIPSLASNTALERFYCHNNQLTGSIPSLTNNTSLELFRCYDNQITGWDGGALPSSLVDFQAQDNALPQATVDALLSALDAAGASNGTCNLSGGANAAPSATGEAAITSLRGRGWAVTVTGGY